MCGIKLAPPGTLRVFKSVPNKFVAVEILSLETQVLRHLPLRAGYATPGYVALPCGCPLGPRRSALLSAARRPLSPAPRRLSPQVLAVFFTRCCRRGIGVYLLNYLVGAVPAVAALEHQFAAGVQHRTLGDAPRGVVTGLLREHALAAGGFPVQVVAPVGRQRVGCITDSQAARFRDVNEHMPVTVKAVLNLTVNNISLNWKDYYRLTP